ncbi:MAG: hypothetical protein JRF07_06175 [Deltaproteobacteria bacterium]|jgi:hypothetical protein|nr:hypothetical protein [Deltaproteobacteria bacterium]
MRLKLGEFLINHGIITQNQLEEALQAQVIFGGKLGTILIEMELISERSLAAALNRIHRYSCAQPDELENIPESVIQILPKSLAAKYKAVPLAVSGRKLKLAMSDPKDLKAIDEIAYRTGYVVLPVLALEMRLALALENYYGIKRTMRFITPAKSVSDELELLHTVDTAVEECKHHLNDPVPHEKALDNSSEQPIVQAATKHVSDRYLESATQETLHDNATTVEKTALKLANASDRNDVADALAEFLAPRYFRAALFMVVSNTITGWRAIKNGAPIDGIETFQVTLTESTVFKTAIDSRRFFLGPIPESSANLPFIKLLGEPKPQSAILLPLVMQGRVVGLIYVDDPNIALSDRLTELQEISHKALMSFEILILQNKILRH